MSTAHATERHLTTNPSAMNSFKEWPRQHLRMLVNASVSGLDGNKSTINSSLASSSRHQAVDTKALTDDSEMTSTWCAAAGVWLLVVCAVALRFWVAKRVQQQPSSFDDSFHTTHSPILMGDNEAEDTSRNVHDDTRSNDTFESEGTDSNTVVAAKPPSVQNSVITRCSVVSSVRSLVDSGNSLGKSSLSVSGRNTCGGSLVPSIETDSSLIDPSEYDEDEVYSRSMISIDLEPAPHPVEIRDEELTDPHLPTSPKERELTVGVDAGYRL